MERNYIKKELNKLRSFSAKTKAACLAGISRETLRKYLLGYGDENKEINNACLQVIEICKQEKHLRFIEQRDKIFNEIKKS